MNSHHRSAVRTQSVPSGSRMTGTGTRTTGPLPRPAGASHRAVTAALTAATVIAVATGFLTPGQAVAAGGRLGDCGAGQLCLWEKPQFKGKRLTFELADTDIESCVVLPKGFTADAYANHTGRPVTLYQSAECASTGDFHTHPDGSYTPESAYQVRAFKIWER
ncbi:peptidase inhibitor family I36 protein [Streptomyces sp. NPDC054784]